jgi:hypothetical protein
LDINFDDNTDLIYWTNIFGFEFIDTQLLNAAGVNQWSTVFGSATKALIIGTRGQITNEATTIIDGTYALKMQPYSCVNQSAVLHARPIQIPVNEGQTVTVKISLRKNVSKATGRRPTAYLFGLGIDDEAEMADVNNTWNEVAVSGTAGVTGFVDFWVSAGFNDYDPAGGDNFYTPKTLGTVTVYADGLSVTYS